MTTKDGISKKMEHQANLFGVLTHPARLAILEILRFGEECVCHMEANLGFRQAYLSQQLSVLRRAGLVQIRRDKRNVFYRVIEPRVYDILDAARFVAHDEIFSVENDPNCSCPNCEPKEFSSQTKVVR